MFVSTSVIPLYCTVRMITVIDSYCTVRQDKTMSNLKYMRLQAKE